MTVKEQVIKYIEQYPGATDAEIERALNKSHQHINQECRSLAKAGYLVRKKNLEKYNLIGNFPLDKIYTFSTHQICQNNSAKSLQEDDIKSILNNYLIENGWDTKVAWGHRQGIDIEACKGDNRWIIEVKGSGSKQEMRVNYFISILGEILQRMNDDNARYSIAFPDIEQYRKLWNKLPELAKQRTTVDLILVDEKGNICFTK